MSRAGWVAIGCVLVAAFVVGMVTANTCYWGPCGP